jgi:hypothetical protein
LACADAAADAEFGKAAGKQGGQLSRSSRSGSIAYLPPIQQRRCSLLVVRVNYLPTTNYLCSELNTRGNFRIDRHAKVDVQSHCAFEYRARGGGLDVDCMSTPRLIQSMCLVSPISGSLLLTLEKAHLVFATVEQIYIN